MKARIYKNVTTFGPEFGQVSVGASDIGSTRPVICFTARHAKSRESRMVALDARQVRDLASQLTRWLDKNDPPYPDPSIIEGENIF